MIANNEHLQEGDRVKTDHGERATVYMVHPNGVYVCLQMTDQYMSDGGVAFRTVPIETVTKEAKL